MTAYIKFLKDRIAESEMVKDEGDFVVLKKDGKYFYGSRFDEDFWEMELIASMTYTKKTVPCIDREKLIEMFDHNVWITLEDEGRIHLLWFKEIVEQK